MAAVVPPPAWCPPSGGIGTRTRTKTCLEWQLKSPYGDEGDGGGCRGGGLRRTAAVGWLLDVESRGHTVWGTRETLSIKMKGGAWGGESREEGGGE